MKTQEGNTLVNGFSLSDYVHAEKCLLGEAAWDERLVKALHGLKPRSRDYQQVRAYINRVLYISPSKTMAAHA